MSLKTLPPRIDDIKCQPIGTVDLFMDDAEYAEEIIVMIADRQHRRKGLAREAVSLAARCLYLYRKWHTRTHTHYLTSDTIRFPRTQDDTICCENYGYKYGIVKILSFDEFRDV